MVTFYIGHGEDCESASELLKLRNVVLANASLEDTGKLMQPHTLERLDSAIASDANECASKYRPIHYHDSKMPEKLGKCGGKESENLLFSLRETSN